MFKTADVYCSEITFFTMMHPPPLKKNKETILYKECKWKLWKVKYENVFKITFFFNVLAQDLQPTMRLKHQKRTKERKG